MRRILVTGMSATGKSTALAELARRGYEVVETDVRPWSEWSDAAGGYVWREDTVGALLDRELATTLYVAGAVSNQGRFYPRFDAVVLLSAPEDVIVERLAARTTNEFGKTAEERERILDDIREVEPLLRASCTHEIDATKPVSEVVEDLIAIGNEP